MTLPLTNVTFSNLLTSEVGSQKAMQSLAGWLVLSAAPPTHHTHIHAIKACSLNSPGFMRIPRVHILTSIPQQLAVADPSDEPTSRFSSQHPDQSGDWRPCHSAVTSPPTGTRRDGRWLFLLSYCVHFLGSDKSEYTPMLKALLG